MSDDGCERGPDESILKPDKEIAIDGGHDMLEGLLEVMMSQRRRHILYYLQDHNITTLSALATHIISTEKGISPSDVTPAQVDGARTTLVHSDLPKMEAAGLLEYDHRSGAIRYEDPPPILDVLLRATATFDRA